MGLDEKVQILVTMVEAFSHTGRCRQDNGQNCLTVVHLYFQDFWMQSSSNFSRRNNGYETNKNKAFLKKYLGILVFEVLVFEVLVFEVLAFEVLVFEVLVFEVLVLEVLAFEVLVFEVLVFDFFKSFIS